MEKFKAHILVVDDDDGIRELVKEYLNHNNYLVTTSNSSEDALEKVKVIKFDLIVLDIMMPGKDGLQFTEENKDKISTPIILLTAKGEANERIEGLDKGADDYLPKPFEPKELILRINNILNKTKYIEQKSVIIFEDIKIDLNKQIIFKNKNEFKINNTEKIILEKMINNPGKTFSREDIGKLIEGKYLKITDRKKEIFKTSGGKYIAPQVMENKFKQSMFIEQIMVIGENEKHPAALIVPDFEILKKWCKNHNISFNDNEDIISKQVVLEKYSKEIEKYNYSFNQYEQIKKFELLPKIWGPDTGELTATLKLKRRNVLEKYKFLYNKIYN